MTKEQRKAINNLKEIIELAKDEINKNDKDVTAILDITDLKSIKTILSMLEEQDKIIDLMSEKIYEEGIVFDNKEEVKQYFENKAKEEK